MSNFSPNVVAREFDFSDYAIRASTSILGVVGFSLKGPFNTPVSIGSERELIDTFGYPETALDGQDYVTKNMILPCIHYLRQGNQLVVVRAGTGAKAAITLLDTDDASALTVTAISEGTWPTLDSVVVVISEGSAGGAYFKLSITVGGVVKEQYDNLTLSSLDPTNKPSYRINNKSFYITVAETNATNTLAVASGSFSLTGGSESSRTAAAMILALDQFSDPELVTINMLITPGSAYEISDTTQTVARAALVVAENRGDTIYIMDTPYSATSSTLTKTAVNGTGSYGAAFDSSYGAFYSPWVQVYDNYNKVLVWAPPCGLIAGMYAYNDRVSQAWFAPAGLNRGKIRSAVKLQFNYTRSELESVQAPREVINPIRNIVGEGVTVWGQKTMQRRSSALDRVNVRRMLNYAKATVTGACRVLLFEPNDSKTWRRFSQLVSPVIQNIKDTRGLYDFRVICDESTNPPSVIDQNMMIGKILLKPTKTAETIYVDFNILSTGANFSEFV